MRARVLTALACAAIACPGEGRRAKDKDEAYVERMSERIEGLLCDAEAGRDALASERGIVWRGYRSRFSSNPQLYSAYIPEGYDPARPMPLIVTLHGGSSNHNVWLALNLGNDISVADYWDNFRTEYRARRHPAAIVVAPDGLGQVRWRWAGEQDVLDVIDDVSANYNIDPDRVVLTGLSNGAIGAYTVGLKHASRFASVLPLAGVTDWLTHHEAEGRLRWCERNVLRNESAVTYAENAANTFLAFYHGERDPGFKVDQARAMADSLGRLGIPFRYHELSSNGHDIGFAMWRRLQVMDHVRARSRAVAPAEVRLVTASGRANRQAWVVLDDRLGHLTPGRISARVTATGAVEVETENVQRFTLLLEQAPVPSPLTIHVDGQRVYSGAMPLDNRLTLAATMAPAAVRRGDEVVSEPLWREWDGALPAPGNVKNDAVSGPLGDPNYEPQVHVYGTAIKEDVPLLRKAALLGARGWMAAWDYTEIRHRVIPDTELTWELMRNNTVVLYGNGANNSVLAEIGDRLPIKVLDRTLEMRGEKVSGWGVGARFVCPNPLAPQRYLVVAAGVTAEAVESGGRLPLYMADYMVYNKQTTSKKAFMILGGRKEIETGYFTEDWRLPAAPPAR